jgi:hypothetical protein
MDIVSNEVVGYWAALVATLNQRGLLRDRPQQGGKVLPEADALLLPDRVIFALDMQRLGGIAKERWQDPALWAQWQAALQGRRCFVSDGGGLAICIAREPGEHIRRLPATVPLDLENLPEAPYTVTLGVSRRGRVTLDLAGKNRAVLIGGTSGAGKTNAMQSIILQLAAKRAPEEVQFAVVDTKQVDFGPTFDRLPHLFAPIAHTLEDAAQLIEAVESERLRRQAVMAAVGVADWRQADGLGLLLLVVDEAADFAKTPAMNTLVEVARKGRAMGISLVLATQSPSAKVISPQVRANLPTAIAFQTRTDIESRVILGKKGAEDLNRPGLALTFTDRWERVQTLHVELPDVAHVAPPPRPALEEIERRLVRYAVEELDGAFTINALADAFAGDISRRQLLKLGKQWESRGWLTTPAHASDPRRVTDELLCLAQGRGNDTTVPQVPRGTTDGEVVPGRYQAGYTAISA